MDAGIDATRPAAAWRVLDLTSLWGGTAFAGPGFELGWGQVPRTIGVENHDH